MRGDLVRRVLDDAARSDAYGNLNAGAKLVWLVERGIALARAESSPRGRGHRRPRVRSRKDR